MALGMFEYIVVTVLVLACSWLWGLLYPRIAKWRFMRLHNCSLPPQLPQKMAASGTDFLNTYNSKRESAQATRFLEDMLLAQPGRTAAVVVLGQSWVFTSHPDNIRAILTTEASNMKVEPSRKDNNKDWIGDGMFMSDGPHWKQARQQFKPMLSRVPISNLSRFAGHAARFFDVLPADGTTVDLQPVFKRMFLGSAFEIMLGESANSEGPGPAKIEVEKFEQSWDAATSGSYKRTFTTSSPTSDKTLLWKRNCKAIHDVFDRYIEHAIEEHNVSGGLEKRDGDASMLQNLVSQSQDKLFLRDQLMNVFVGAKDTTGVGISGIIFHLARHPHVFEKLRSEVASIEDQPLTFELLKSMKYLQAVMNESLRLISPVTLTLRSPDKDVVLPRGGGADGQDPIYVAKGSRIEVSIAVLHLDPEYWGDDAAEFRPERWEDGFAPRWQYAPFLGGARMCPAQQLILTQYGYLLVQLARKFRKIENRDPVEKFVPEVIFAQQIRNGAKVALYR